MKTKILLSILFGVLVLVACKKDPPPDKSTVVMPPLTHQGLNTFGCYINFPSEGASGEQAGELFVANDGDSYWDIPAVSGSFNETTKELNLQGTRYKNNDIDEVDYFQLSAILGDGLTTYNYKYNIDGKTIGYRNWNGTNCDYYFDNVLDDVGKITITHLNEESNIVSGTFYINLYNDKCEGDTLMKITDGRFDLKY